MSQKIDNVNDKIESIAEAQEDQGDRIRKIYEEELPEIRREIGGLEKNGDHREKKIKELKEDLDEAENKLKREKSEDDGTTIGEIKGLASSTQAFVLILISLLVILIGAIRFNLI